MQYHAEAKNQALRGHQRSPGGQPAHHRTSLHDQYSTRFWVFAFFALLFAAMLSMPALALDLAQADRAFQQWEQKLVHVEERVQDGRLGELSTRALRRSVEQVMEQITEVRATSTTESDRIRRLLASLGAAPEDGAEDLTVQTKRAELTTELARHEGQVKHAGLIIARAEQALADLTRETRLRFQQHILKKGVSPLSPTIWVEAVTEFVGLLVHSYVEAPLQWMSETVDKPERMGAAFRYALLSFALAAAGWPLGRWLLARFGRRPDVTNPSYARRLLAAFVEAVARGLIPVLFVAAVGILFTDDALLGLELRVMVDALARYLVIFFIGYGLIKAVFTPGQSAWRITSLHTGASNRVVQRLRAILLIFVIFGGIGQSLTWATPSDSLESVYLFAFAVTLYTALWALLRHRVWMTGGKAAVVATASDTSQEAEPAKPSGGLSVPKAAQPWAKARTILSVALLAIPVSAAAGYPKLTGFLIDASMLTGLVVAGALALRWLGRGATNELLTGQDGVGYRLRTFLELSDEASLRLRFWLYFAFDLILTLTVVSALLPFWGFGAEETMAWITRLFRGIQIGSYTFSLLDLLLAISFFAAIMLATRLVQRGLERHFLPNVVRDVGVRDALRTGVGYIGVVIAALVGISTLGLDLSNLALIAGALSVGLGFGLQNIVSNFVSGLILLAERPIKPGDWIVVGGHEGTVKKVNVRSTEIETFQRASVIIPNADLIATPVTNWTHKNVLGRLELKIGVAYGSDVTQVRDILLDLANAHPAVLADPGPAVIFFDFGASSLDFELRCYLSDIAWVVVVGSELRFAIYEAFNAAGIDIPFPQHVVHMAPPAPKSGPENGTD